MQESMIEYSKKHPCVRCGYCCTVRPCSYGEWDKRNNRCYWLEEDDKDLGTFKCRLYDYIRIKEKLSPYPMFDNYCSSPLMNTIRENVIAKTKKSAVTI